MLDCPLAKRNLSRDDGITTTTAPTSTTTPTAREVAEDIMVNLIVYIIFLQCLIYLSECLGEFTLWVSLPVGAETAQGSL